MTNKKVGNIKLRHLKIKNFKALDSLELDFPEPLMPNDPDILVIGSKNGVGKTSVLEACSLLFLAISGGDGAFYKIFDSDNKGMLRDLLIRAGKEQAVIEGTFENSNGTANIEIILYRNVSEYDSYYSLKGDIIGDPDSTMGYAFTEDLVVKRFLPSFLGMSPEPMMLSPFLYFHSYRKTREGDPELKEIVDGGRVYQGSDSGIPAFHSDFKAELIRLMMSSKDMMEEMGVEEAKTGLDKLNEFVKHYADRRISDKIRPTPDNRMGIRIAMPRGEYTFPFDGLSSGQKEMITTLFTIWWHTRIHPGIILIDEPELHMNAEWHRLFINQLHELAPHNQYIIASHSEDVFDAVDKNHRVILRKAKGEQE
ncbi:MAG: AAA family ATPase [Candidatus Hatepunaea meridiana]|nr:AAA family ATPase [Candidatus Hatepunaea meridiana]